MCSSDLDDVLATVVVHRVHCEISGDRWIEAQGGHAVAKQSYHVFRIERRRKWNGRRAPAFEIIHSLPFGLRALRRGRALLHSRAGQPP